MQPNFQDANLRTEEIDAWLDSVLAQKGEWVNPNNKLTYLMIVSYRGRYCGHCKEYVRQLNIKYREIRATGGKVILYCGQGKAYTKQTGELWDLPFDYHISDNLNIFAHYLKDKGGSILCSAEKEAILDSTTRSG